MLGLRGPAGTGGCGREETCRVSHLFGGVGAGECHQGPEGDAKTHDELPVVPVAKVTEERRQEHVAADENWTEVKGAQGSQS